jgi:hypothetical protein
VGRGDAVCALDREWGATVAAVDGEPKSRRRSGEVWWSEQERMPEMCVCKRKSEWARSSRMCSGSRRGCGCAGAGAGTPAEDVVARAAVQHGESRGGQRGVGTAAARRGRARGSVQCGAEAAGALHNAVKSGGGASGSETEEEEEER